MENNEKYIVDSLKNYREEIDLDGLWAEVSPQIPKEKKRRKIGFWIFGGMVIALMSFGILWMTNVSGDLGEPNLTDTKDAMKNQYENIENDHASHSETIQSSLIGGNKNDHINANSDLFGDVNNYDSSTNTNEETKKTSTLNDTKQNFEVNKIDELINPNNTSVSVDIGDRKATIHYDNIVSILNIESNSLEKKEADINIAFDEENIRREQFLAINPLVFLLNHEVKSKNERNLIRPEIVLSLQKVQNLFSGNSRWSFYLSGGVAAVSRNLNTRLIELQPELERRKSVVKVLGAWEAEGGLGFRITPKLKLRTGLNYTQIHEKANFESDYLVNINVETNNLINKQDGSVDIETGSIAGQGLRHTEEIRYNQLRLLQIPLRISYEMLAINNFKINVGAMASYTLQQNYVGVTSFSSSLESYDLRIDKDNKFRTNGSVGYGLFLEGTTHLSKVLDFSFSLGYKHTRKINTEIYLIDQQYNSLSFTSGVSRRF